MYEFHTDKDRYFEMQYQVTKAYILPYIKEVVPGIRLERVLEIGCAEAGVLKAFLEEGAHCTGIELSHYRIASAEKYHQQALAEGRIQFVNRNIFDIDPEHDLGGRFDLVILKDVIEHIHGQEEFLSQLPSFLNPEGVVFFGFPPWQMPYGGHQQIARGKLTSKLPFYHLLPNPIYKSFLKLQGEPEPVIRDLMEIKETGISIERFERCLRKTSFQILGKRLYLFNPIYFYKFGVKPRLQFPILKSIPLLRNFITSAAYYVVTPKFK